MVRRTVVNEGDNSDDEDFAAFDEEEGATIDCPHCGREIYDGPLCPHCDRYVEEETAGVRRRPIWFWIGLIACGYVALQWLRP